MKPLKRDPQAMTRDGPALDRAMAAAARKVIRRHRQLGVPLVIWRNGKVVEVDPATLDEGAAEAAATEVAAGAKSG